MLLIATINGWHYLFAIPLFLLSLFLVLVILVQRGRGGGLTGALGGMGGQSAFGTKAGDLFTRITIITAAIWVLLSMAALKILNQQSQTGGLRAGAHAPVSPGKEKAGPAGKGETTSDEAPAKNADSSSPPATSEQATPPAPGGEPAAKPAEAPQP
jgi:preprotein translocase subunit SecG